MDRVDKLELIKRSLGLRHKIKVHESIKSPDNHEELALMLLAKWELEDELRAIEQVLLESREENTARKKSQVEKEHEIVSPAAKRPKKTPRKP